MTVGDHEKFYDEQIAPVLLDLAKKCEENGLPFVAVVEYSAGNLGRTAWTGEHGGIGIQMVNVAAQANGNADILIGFMLRHGEKHGHNSALIHMIERVTNA